MAGTYSFVFFGEDVFSLAVLESLVDVQLGLKPLAVVMLEPVSVSGTRLITFCKERCIPLVRTDTVHSEQFLSQFEHMEIDLMISAHFKRLLPSSLFNRAKLGALNLHPSLLPRYRGMSPQHWPIVHGDTETGVTVHRIDDGVDTGRILRQVRIPLESGIYIHELQKKLLVVYRSIMFEAVERAIAGEPGEPQSTKGTSYFHKLHEEDMEITPESDVVRAGNMVRAFSFPYAGAWFENVRIMKAVRTDDSTWAVLKGMSTKPSLLEYQNGRYLLLKDGALELTKWIYL